MLIIQFILHFMNTNKILYLAIIFSFIYYERLQV